MWYLFSKILVIEKIMITKEMCEKKFLHHGQIYTYRSKEHQENNRLQLWTQIFDGPHISASSVVTFSGDGDLFRTDADIMIHNGSLYDLSQLIISFISECENNGDDSFDCIKRSRCTIGAITISYGIHARFAETFYEKNGMTKNHHYSEKVSALVQALNNLLFN